MEIPIFQVDAFSDVPFRGNPAAICLLDDPLSDDMMQNIAKEMNLSETAFVHEKPDGKLNLRWFTPMYEVDLCGHATLASAYVLWHQGRHEPSHSIEFQTKSGTLICNQTSEGVELDFPASPPESAEPPPGLVAALGKDPTFVGKSKFDYFLVYDDEENVRTMTPNFADLANVETRGVIVTAVSEDPEIDFVSRFFAPSAGIDEDPVTGSAHCCIAPYWSSVMNKRELVGYQASQRGGVIKIVYEPPRVRLAGQAVMVLQGSLHV